MKFYIATMDDGTGFDRYIIDTNKNRLKADIKRLERAKDEGQVMYAFTGEMEEYSFDATKEGILAALHCGANLAGDCEAILQDSRAVANLLEAYQHAKAARIARRC